MINNSKFSLIFCGLQNIIKLTKVNSKKRKSIAKDAAYSKYIAKSGLGYGSESVVKKSFTTGVFQNGTFVVFMTMAKIASVAKYKGGRHGGYKFKTV